MRRNKFTFLSLLVSVLALGMQSCFQDLDQDPPFNYPEGNPDPTGEFNPQKLFLPFEGNVYDQSTYQFAASGMGDISFVDGVNGRAYKGGEDAYILIENHPAISNLIADTLSNLGSFTVAFWMNSSRNTSATGIFSITNTTTFWSNLDIFLENTGSETDPFFKVHMLNERTGTTDERWVEYNVPDVFGKWTHMAFVYNGQTSRMNIYKNGSSVLETVLDGMGELQFNNLGPMIIGTFPFQADPSLTSGADNQEWAGYYEGALDQFYFYNVPLSASAIRALYGSKE